MVTKNSTSLSGRRYTNAIRVLTMVAMGVVMYISAQFSKDGFSFNLPNYEWIGWTLAVISIVVQLAWNRMEGKDLTIYVIGFSVYAYSIYTNVIGVHAAQSGNSGWAFPIILGVILDILPEPLFVWALTYGSISSDPIGKLFQGLDGGWFSNPSTNTKRKTSPRKSTARTTK